MLRNAWARSSFFVLFAFSHSAFAADEHKIQAADGEEYDYFGYAVATNGTVNLVGAPFDDDIGGNAGAVYVYDMDENQIAKLYGSGTDDVYSDDFGFSIAVEGNIAVIGARSHLRTGAAYIFDISTGTELYKLVPDDLAQGDEFGWDCDISGDVVVVASLEGDGEGATDVGAVYVFDATTGVQTMRISPDDGAFRDRFGESVALDGTTLVVGCSRDDDNGDASGSAYVYDVTTGNLLHKLTPSDPSVTQVFGNGVDIDGDTIVVGAPFDDEANSDVGAAYLFDAVTGAELQKFMPSDDFIVQYYGTKVALDGMTLIVGAPNDQSHPLYFGSAYFYDLATGTEFLRVRGTDFDDNQRLGSSISIQGGKAIIGAYQGDGNEEDTGLAFDYTFCNHEASWENYGDGWAGTNGIPNITPQSAPVIGETLTINVDSSSGVLTNGFLVTGFSDFSGQTNLDGTLLVFPSVVNNITVGPSGAVLTGDVPNEQILLCGVEYYMQVLQNDSGASRGVSFTPGLKLTFGGY